MPPRNTLAWERCEICGRHSPTIECVLRGRRTKVCAFCESLFKNWCKGSKTYAKGTKLSPDESLIESITKEVSESKRRSRTRRR